MLFLAAAAGGAERLHADAGAQVLEAHEGGDCLGVAARVEHGGARDEPCRGLDAVGLVLLPGGEPPFAGAIAPSCKAGGDVFVGDVQGVEAR